MRIFAVVPNPVRGIRRLAYLLNRLRRRMSKLDYVVFYLPARISALPVTRSWLQKRLLGEPEFSLADIDKAFRQLGDDPRVKGIVLIINTLEMPLADLQTLRNSILRIKEKGKRVICSAGNYDLNAYYLASAADEIILQPGGDLFTLGLRSNPVFLKDALNTVGVQMEVVAISPFKSAFDQLARQTITPESEAQLNWLLDSRYEMLLQDIATGRNKSVAEIEALVDCSPHVDQKALEAGYVDALLHEHQLADYLGAEHLKTWDDAEHGVYKPWRKPAPKVVALLPLEGLIVPGKSQTPPLDIPLPIPIVGDSRMGDITIIQQIRRLAQLPNIAAVILFIDSPGGSALASEAISAELNELAKTRPIVAYMNNVAASGGYYIATPARWIVAQPGTITGSIGVISGKPVTQGIFNNLKLNRMEFTRGVNAGILSDATPFNEAQHIQMRAMIEHLYGMFIKRVAESRQMTLEAVDAVGGGRVWTGTQAKAHGLVDELGDLQAALKKARELANLPEDAPLVLPKMKIDEMLLPKLTEKANPAAGLRYLSDSVKTVLNAHAQFLLDWTLR